MIENYVSDKYTTRLNVEQNFIIYRKHRGRWKLKLINTYPTGRKELEEKYYKTSTGLLNKVKSISAVEVKKVKKWVQQWIYNIT